MNRQVITLGIFRKYTEHLSDDIKLYFNFGSGLHPITTMNPIGDDIIEFASGSYMGDDIEGMIKTAAMLKKKGKENNYER